MGDYLQRPSADVSSGGTITKTGFSGSYASGISDNSDSTLAQFTGGGGNLLETLPILTLGTNEYITQYRYAVRWRCSGVGHANIAAYVVDGSGNIGVTYTWTQVSNPNFATYYSDWYTVGPAGDAAVPADLARMNLIALNDATLPQLADVWVEVVTATAPEAAGTGPNSTVGTTRPPITWSYSSPDGNMQERFWIRGYNWTKAGLPYFDPRPGGTTPDFDSGEQFGSQTSWTPNVDLVNGMTYRIYIFVAQKNSGGVYNYQYDAGYYLSHYAYCTVTLIPPAVPCITRVFPLADGSGNSFALEIQDRQNMLDTFSSDFDEPYAGSYAAIANCVVNGISTTQKEMGTQSLKVTGSASGNATFQNSTAMPDINAGTTYSARIAAFAATTARVVRLDIIWQNSSFATISTTQGSPVTETVGAWTAMFVTGVAPAGAAYYILRVNILSTVNTEVHYFDDTTFVPGALNMLRDPIFELDSDGDGMADYWAKYVVGGSATASLETTPDNVFAGIASQRVDFTGSPTYVGVFQSGISVAVTAGQTYQISGWYRSSFGNCFIGFYSDIDNAQATLGPSNAGFWNEFTFTYTATATGNTHIFIRFNALPASGTVWLGQLQMEVGSSTSVNSVCDYYDFTTATLAQPLYWEIQRSVDDGATWDEVSRVYLQSGNHETPIDMSNIQNYRDGNQLLSLIQDYESPRNVTVIYRVRAGMIIGATHILSQWSVWFRPPNKLPIGGSYVKNPFNASQNIPVGMNQLDLNNTRPQAQGQHWAFGREDPIIVYGTTRMGSFPVTLFFKTDADYQAWMELQDAEITLLLQTCYGDNQNDQYYFTISPQVNDDTWTVFNQNNAQPRQVSFTAQIAAQP